jgi:predicted Zn-dependent protease
MNHSGRTGFSRRSLLRLTAALPAVGGAALLQASEPEISVPSYNDLTDRQEIEFGRKAAAEYDAKLPILHIGPLEDYCNSMVVKLGRASKRPNMDYKARVINTMEVNAFSIMGGHLWVYRGLLEFAQNESELAGVLAHEVGHVVGHHCANKLATVLQAKHIWAQVKDNVLLQNPVIQQIIQKLGGPLAMLALLKYERDQEFQADMFGFYELLRTGWDPNGIIHMFERLRDATGGDPDLIRKIQQDHPPLGERVARFRKEMSSVRMPAKTTTDSFSFKAMKLGLKILPPPAKPQKE